MWMTKSVQYLSYYAICKLLYIIVDYLNDNMQITKSNQ